MTAVDPQSILEKVNQLPVTTWSYIHDEEKTRHIGPMAQDFKRLFEVGIDDKTIAYMDKDGVALAAIQGLSSNAAQEQSKVEELRKLVAAQKAQLQSQSALLAKQHQMIQTLDERMRRVENTVPLASTAVSR